MKYTIEFFDEDVQQAVLTWPAGINTSFTRIALRMVEHGANLGLHYTKAIGGGLSKYVPRDKKAVDGRFSAPWSGNASLSCTASSKKPTRHPT